MKTVAISLRFVILVFIIVATVSLSADVRYGLPTFVTILTIGVILAIIGVHPGFPPRLSLIALPAYVVAAMLMYRRFNKIDDSFPWGICFLGILLVCGFAFVSLQLQSDRRTGASNSNGRE